MLTPQILSGCLIAVFAGIPEYVLLRLIETKASGTCCVENVLISNCSPAVKPINPGLPLPVLRTRYRHIERNWRRSGNYVITPIWCYHTKSVGLIKSCFNCTESRREKADAKRANSIFATRPLRRETSRGLIPLAPDLLPPGLSRARNKP